MYSAGVGIDSRVSIRGHFPIRRDFSFSQSYAESITYVVHENAKNALHICSDVVRELHHVRAWMGEAIWKLVTARV